MSKKKPLHHPHGPNTFWTDVGNAWYGMLGKVGKPLSTKDASNAVIPKANYSKKDFPDAVRGGYQISPTTAYWHAAHRKSDADVAKILSDPKNQYFELYGGVKPNPPKKPPGERENENGIKQKGKDLSSSTLGQQLRHVLPETDGAVDANSFIQGEGATPAPGAGLNLNMPGVSAESFYKQPPVPFQIPDEAGPKMAMEMSPESLKASENAFSADMTKYTPLLANIQEAEAKKAAPKAETPKKGKASGANWMESGAARQLPDLDPEDAALVSPMYANAARNAARSAFLDAPNSEGPMGTIRRRNAAVGLNAAGNIAKIDGQNYNVSPEQAWALTGGAGNTREGLDAIKNAATPYVAPGTQAPGTAAQAMKVDTSNLAPGAKAAVDLAMSGPQPFTTQGMTDENAAEKLAEFNQYMGNVPENVQTAASSIANAGQRVMQNALSTTGDAFKKAYMQRMAQNK